MHKDSALTAVILVAHHLEIKLSSERKAPRLRLIVVYHLQRICIRFELHTYVGFKQFEG